MPLVSTLREVNWSPASYMRFEIEPSWTLSPQLYAFGTYRFYSKDSDSYQLINDEESVISPGAIPISIEDLENESSRVFHQAGLGLRYSTLNVQTSKEQRPAELYGRVIYTVAGSGGHTPVTTRVEFGIQLFQKFW